MAGQPRDVQLAMMEIYREEHQSQVDMLKYQLDTMKYAKGKQQDLQQRIQQEEAQVAWWDMMHSLTVPRYT